MYRAAWHRHVRSQQSKHRRTASSTGTPRWTRREPGVYDADLSAGWTIFDAVNGGYLLAPWSAAPWADALPHPTRSPITAHYLTASQPGPAVIRTETVRTGRTLSTGQASLFQLGADGDEVERIRVLASLRRPRRAADDVRTTRQAARHPALRAVLRQRRTPRRAGHARQPEIMRPPQPAARPRHRWAGPSVRRPARARCAPGSASPTGATPTRSRCCSRWTRSRRPPSTWA